MARKIVQLAGPACQWAVCDDGSVWFWNWTGAQGRWVPWDRPTIPQPEAVAFSTPGDPEKFPERDPMFPPPPVPPGVPPAAGGLAPAPGKRGGRR